MTPLHSSSRPNLHYPAGGLLGFNVLLHSVDYTEGLNLGSLQTSSYNRINKYFGRMTALPLSRLDAVILWHVKGWHHLCSTNDTGLSCLLNCCTEKKLKLLPEFFLSFIYLFRLCRFFYSHISLHKRLCFLQVFFLLSQHLPSSAGIQTLVALPKYFLWCMLWLQEVHLSWGPTSFADFS